MVIMTGFGCLGCSFGTYTAFSLVEAVGFSELPDPILETKWFKSKVNENLVPTPRNLFCAQLKIP